MSVESTLPPLQQAVAFPCSGRCMPGFHCNSIQNQIQTGPVCIQTLVV